MRISRLSHSNTTYATYRSSASILLTISRQSGMWRPSKISNEQLGQFQYRMSYRLESVRSVFRISNRSGMWWAFLQHCWRGAGQIAPLHTRSHGFDTSRSLRWNILSGIMTGSEIYLDVNDARYLIFICLSASEIFISNEIGRAVHDMNWKVFRSE